MYSLNEWPITSDAAALCPIFSDANRSQLEETSKIRLCLSSLYVVSVIANYCKMGFVVFSRLILIEVNILEAH